MDTGLIHHADPNCEAYLRWILEGYSVFANAPFDLGVWGRKFPRLIPLIFDALDNDRIFDVLTREALIDIGRGSYRIEEDEDGNRKKALYSLADCVRRRLRIWMEKDEWRLRYHDFYDVPLGQWPEGARKYAMDDARLTHALFEAQEPLATAGAIPDQHAQVRGHWALDLISSWGIRTSLGAVQALEKRVRLEFEEVRELLTSWHLVREDGSRDTKAAKRIMLDAMGKDVILTETAMLRVKQKVTTRDQEILDMNICMNEEACKLSGNEALFKYGRYSKLLNLLRKDVKDLKTGTITPIQTRFTTPMETGRSSSSGPNIQNLKKEAGVRECFCPREGCAFVAADFEAAELGSLAQVCIDMFGWSKLADAINAGVDPHLLFASQLLRIPYEEAVRARKDERHPLHKEVVEKRQVSKAANFGFPGGLGVKRFLGYAKGYGIADLDYHFAAKLKAEWFEAWPEMDLYFKWINEQQDDEGWHWIQQHRSGRIRGKCTFTQAANSKFQGLTADYAKASLYEITRAQFIAVNSPLYGTAVVNHVHDEHIVECREEIVHPVAEEMKRIMIEVAQRYTPDVRVGVEIHAMRYWSKYAKTVRDDAGRLIPWGRAA